FFHSWSGDCLQTLRVAKKRNIPSLIEIPTWHRGAQPGGTRAVTSDNRGRRQLPVLQGVGRWKQSLLLERERFLEEYELADLIVVLSKRAAESFRLSGFPERKLFYLPRGVDTDRFHPGRRPPVFRVVFSGALIERKGVHHLLAAWH